MTIGTPVSSPIGNFVIDARAEHPDGLVIFRVNDHWFPEHLLSPA